MPKINALPETTAPVFTDTVPVDRGGVTTYKAQIGNLASSNPGVAAALLKTDASGHLRLVSLGLGCAPTQSLDIEKGNIRLGQVACPIAPTLAINAAAGNLNGAYYYSVSFVTAAGETEASQESAVVNPANQQVDITFAVSTDAAVTQRKIYRTTVGGWHKYKFLVTTIDNNLATTYTDNLADVGLGVPEPRVNSTGGRIYNNLALCAIIDRSTTAVGVGALISNRGYANTAFGVGALFNNDTGSYNVTIGINALLTNTTGLRNTAVGVDSMVYNTTGYENVAVGDSALAANIDGYENVAIGIRAMQVNTTGYLNMAIGGYALSANITGIGNMAIGDRAARFTDANANVAIGASALYYNVTGVGNVVIGYQAGLGVTGQSFSNNTIVGFMSGIGLTTGSNNTVVGADALVTNTASHANIAIGFRAGKYETGGSQLFIDAVDRGSEANGHSFSLIYGIMDAAVANQYLITNAQFRAMGVGTHYIGGHLGVGEWTPAAFLDVCQTNPSGAVPCLELDQDDVNDAFINYQGTSAADELSSISTKQGDGTVEGPKKFSTTAGWEWVGMVEIEVNGATMWMPYYTPDTA